MAREKRTFIKRKRRESELDITSLLDILVILLVFLLKSYNSSELKVNVVDNLNLPSSESRELRVHMSNQKIDLSFIHMLGSFC